MEPLEFDADLDSSRILLSMRQPQEFGTIFTRHSDAVHRYLSRRVGTSVLEDLLSETFVLAFRKRHTYDHSYPDARPWLFGIATNVVHHHRRSEGRRLAMVARVTRHASTEHDDIGADDDAVARHELDHQVAGLRVVLPRLEEKYLDVLTLFTGPQLSYEEIARALGIPVGTVRSRLSRGRAQLRELLAATGQSEFVDRPATPRPNVERHQP
jgi:RNA polymerase sigma factor (sigma-70 family)